MKSLNRRQLRKNEMAINGENRNKPCPCGSGIKYKKCHGKIEYIKVDDLLAKKKEAEKLIVEVSKLGKKLDKNNDLNKLEKLSK